MPVSHAHASTDRWVELVLRDIVAVKRLAVMAFRDRLFVPGRDAHLAFDKDAIAFRSRAFGAGGLSSSLSTMRLSRSDNVMRSASSITLLASRRAGCSTKSVRSVFLNAAARRSMAFCSDRTRRFIHLFLSAATRDMTPLLFAYLFNAYLNTARLSMCGHSCVGSSISIHRIVIG